MKSYSLRKTETRLRKSLTLTATAVTLLVAALPGTADTFTWDGGGGDGNWSTPENWDGDVLPVDGGTFHTYVFDGTANLITSADLTATVDGLNLGDIIFNVGAGAFTIQGPRPLDMLGVPNGGASGTEFADILNNSTATQTITTELVHRPDLSLGTVFNANAGDILVQGLIRSPNASAPVFVGGANTVVFSGANTYAADTVVGINLVDDDFESYGVNVAPGGDWNQNNTGTVQVEEESPGGNQYLGFGWESGDPSAGSSRTATRTMDPIGTADAAFVTFRVRTESDNGEWYYGVSDTTPNWNTGFAGMNYAASVGLVEDATGDDGKVNLVAGVEGDPGTTVLANLDTNQWYGVALFIDHAAATFDVYLDGVKLNASALPFQNATAGGIDQFTVTGGGGSRFDGQLDDLTAASTATLQFDGTHTGAGSYLVESGSRLTGTGTITLAPGESVGGNALGAVAPGDRSGSITGTLTVVGDVVLDAGTLAVRIDGANDTGDLLAIDGNLDVSGATLDLTDVISAVDDASYTLATYTGVLTGPVFSTVLGLPEGYSISYATVGEIRLQAGGDTDPPLVATLSPADDATEVAAADDLTISFSEIIQAGTGSITLKRTSDDSTVETFNVENSPQLTFAGPSITINPPANLVGGTEYYVLIEPTAVEDAAENAFAGIGSTTAWSFTAETAAPMVATLSPADDASAIFPNARFSMTFDQEVFKGTGNITIHLASDDNEVETFDVTSDAVTVSGATVHFTPATDLPAGAALYVNIPAGAFEDDASNPYGGISNTTDWSFTTGTFSPIVAENFDGTGDPLDGTTAEAFDAAITSAGGSATWSAGPAFLDDGTVSVAGGSNSASLNLGTYIDDAKGSADGKFGLTMTFSETISEWISLGFAQSNTPSTSGNFVNLGGVATLIRRETGDWDLDMFPENGVSVRIEGPEPNDPGDRTVSVTIDLTPAGGYDGSTNFGTVTYTDSTLGEIGTHTYTSDFNFGSILLSESNNSGGTVSALNLVQLTTAAPGAYNTWASGFGLSGPDADITADTENSGAGDGLEQIFEFAFGTNPTVSDNVALEVTSGTTFTPGTPIINVDFSPLNVSYRFVRRVDHLAAGLTYTPQFTADGETFEDSTDTPTVVVPDDGSGYEVVEVPFPVFLPEGMKSKASLARIQLTLGN